MLRARQMKEAKKKEAEAAAALAAANVSGPSAVTGEPSEQPRTSVGGASGGGGMSIFGIGGAKKPIVGVNKSRVKQRTPGEIRVQRDIAELEMGDVAEIKFPSPNDLTKFEVIVTPDSGYWKGATYRFTFNIPAGYPHDPPKVMCATKIYHPNINLQGNVCLNILREEWKPVLQIEHVIHGVLFLFYEPNPGDPLNQEAAEELRNHKGRFERSVRESLRGGYVHGEQFPRLI